MRVPASCFNPERTAALRKKVKFSAARGMDAGGGIIAPVLKDAENGEKYV